MLAVSLQLENEVRVCITVKYRQEERIEAPAKRNVSDCLDDSLPLLYHVIKEDYAASSEQKCLARTFPLLRHRNEPTCGPYRVTRNVLKHVSNIIMVAISGKFMLWSSRPGGNRL